MTVSALRRKLSTVRRNAAPASTEVGLPQARALAQALGQGAGLAVSEARSSLRHAELPEVLDLIDPEGMALLLPMGDGRAGVVALDRPGALGLVEVVTLGAPGRRAPALRPPTSVDAALIEPLLCAFTDPLFPGQRTGPFRLIEDHRLLRVALEDGGYQIFHLQGSMQRDGRARDISVVLAWPSDPAIAERSSPQTAAASDPGDAWDSKLQQAVMAAPCDLRAVLAVVRKPLHEVMAIGVGARLELPLSLLEDVRIEALDGRAYGAGRLGQSRGMRALRLTALAEGPETAARAPAMPPDPAALSGPPERT